MTEKVDKTLILLDPTLVVPLEGTSEQLLAYMAEQNATRIRLEMANLVGLRERSRATALTIATALTVAGNFVPLLPLSYGSPVSTFDITRALIQNLGTL